MSQQPVPSPTPRQLSYLRSLSQQTETTFVSPRTRWQASREIDRLLALKARAERPLPEPRHPDQLALAYGTAPKPGEIVGRGSTARWRHQARSAAGPTQGRAGASSPARRTGREHGAGGARRRGPNVAEGGEAKRERGSGKPRGGAPPAEMGVVGTAIATAASSHGTRRLATYTDRTRVRRELVLARGAGGSRLLIDREAERGHDARLVAHLAADEPDGNATLLARMYLADPTRGRCRRLQRTDLADAPFKRPEPCAEIAGGSPAALYDAQGRSYAIRERAGTGRCPELRWTRTTQGGGPAEALTLREVVGALEAY